MGYITSSVVKTGGVPMHIILPIINFAKVDWFIESGTAGAESIIEASKYFKHCHTVEIVKDRTPIDESIENITWHTGNSANIFPKIVDMILAERVAKGLTEDEYLYSIFYLDGHYSGDIESPAGTKECPVIDEIVSISALKTDAIIIIDDARLHLGSVPSPLDVRQWPRIDKIICLIKELFPHYLVTLRDDYILAYPERLSEPLDKEWRDNFTKRYPSEESKLKEAGKMVWKAAFEYLNK